MTKLLVIEDDTDIGFMIKRHSEKRGYETLWETDGQTALETAQREKPDVMLIDIMLPRLDGRDLVSQVKDEQWFQNAVSLFLTARDSQSDRRVGLELGVDDYITKPINTIMLFNKIEYLLEKKGLPKPTP